MKNFFYFLCFFPHFAWSQADSQLIVGMELAYPPFEMVCSDGSPCGISVSIARALTSFMKCPLLIENIAFVGLIPSLQTDKINCIISSMTITEQRSKAIDFSKPYGAIGLCLLVSKKSSLQSIKDANSSDRIIVVKSGTSGELYAAKHLKKAVVRVFTYESLCVLEVIQGKADAFIYDQLSVYKHWQKNRETTRALLKPFQKDFWGIGIKKGNIVLLNEINRFIDYFRRKGGFKLLADEYLPEEQAAFKKMGIPFIFD